MSIQQSYGSFVNKLPIAKKSKAFMKQHWDLVVLGLTAILFYLSFNIPNGLGLLLLIMPLAWIGALGLVINVFRVKQLRALRIILLLGGVWVIFIEGMASMSLGW